MHCAAVPGKIVDAKLWSYIRNQVLLSGPYDAPIILPEPGLACPGSVFFCICPYMPGITRQYESWKRSPWVQEFQAIPAVTVEVTVEGSGDLEARHQVLSKAFLKLLTTPLERLLEDTAKTFSPLSQ